MVQRMIISGFTAVGLLLGLTLTACDDGGSEGDDDDGSGGTSGATGGTAGAAGTGLTGGMAGSTTGGTAGTSAAGSGGGPSGNQIMWDATGWIDKGANMFGIQGPWYTYNDCTDATPAGLPCTQPDPTLMGPAPDMLPGWSASETQVCMKGTAAQVMMGSDGMPAYSLQWGAGIAFDLNSSGGTPAVISPFNAVEHDITGFTFDITGTAPPTVRINIVMPSTPDTAHFTEVAVPATAVPVNFLNCPDVLTCNIAQGSWVTTPTVFDATQILTVQFQVFTNDTAPKPYDFCVSNFNVVRSGG